MVFKCWMFHLQTLDKLRCRKQRGKLEPQPGQEVHYVTESHLVFNLFRQRWHQRCFRFTTDNGTRDFMVFTGIHRRCMLENWTLCPNSSPCCSISFKNISCIRSLGYASVRVLRLRWALVFFCLLGLASSKESWVEIGRQKSNVPELKYWGALQKLSCSMEVLRRS